MEKKELGLFEQTMVSGIIEGELQKSFALEAAKGCDANVYPYPVDVEPPYQRYELNNFLRPNSHYVQQTPCLIQDSTERIFFRLWFSTKDESTWTEFEAVLKELSILKCPVEFLLAGNNMGITCQWAVSKGYEMILKQALSSRFPNMQIDTSEENCLSHYTNLYVIRDFLPTTSYWNRLSGYEGMKESPLLTVYAALSLLTNEQIGLYQIIFKYIGSRWRNNIVNLIEAQHEAGRYGSITHNPQALTSDYYKEAREKLAGPYFAVSVRVGVFGSRIERGVLDSLSLSLAGLQHGGTELVYLTKSDFLSVLSEKRLIEMVHFGLTYRPGMILTSSELNKLCHIATTDVMARKDLPINRAVGFKATEDCKEGVLLGYNEFAGKKTIVRQPENIRSRHTVLYGITGGGKTTCEIGMIEDDIRRGFCGLAYFDFHSDGIREVLRRIPKNRIKDVFYFQPCDPKFTFQYNPFKLQKGESAGKRTNDLLSGVKDLFSAKDWGHVIESTLMSVFYTLLCGENLCLADARILLARTAEGDRLREKVLPLIDNEDVRLFWVETFESLPLATRDRVLNKIRIFFLDEYVRRIFSQRTNSLNFSQLLNSNKILLVDLNQGALGEASKILGSNLISQFYYAAMNRLRTGEPRKPFNLYIDECAHFMSAAALQNSIRELRKCDVRLILSFQQRETLNEAMRLALGNCGTMIVFDLDWDDAHQVFKSFYGEVDVNEFMRKGIGKAYLKLLNNPINLQTYRLKKIQDKSVMQEIINHSREHHYTPVKEINKDKSVQKQLIKLSDEELYDEI